MWGGRRKSVVNFVLVLSVCVFVAPVLEVGALSDMRLCADPKCQTIISVGTAKINYSAGEKGMVSFKINSPIRIKSKSAGSNMDLWGIEVNGREGYAPKDFILEKRVFISEKNLKHIVPVVPPDTQAQPDLKASESAADIKTEPELSTTTPLAASPSKAKEVPIVTADGVVGEEEKPKEASPVQRQVEVVDGTEIPLGDGDNALLDLLANVEEEEADDDDDEEDEDEDDEDGEQEEIVQSTVASEAVKQNEQLPNSVTDSKEKTQSAENELPLLSEEPTKIVTPEVLSTKTETTKSSDIDPQKKTDKEVPVQLNVPGQQLNDAKQDTEVNLSVETSTEEKINEKTEKQNSEPIPVDQQSNEINLKPLSVVEKTSNVETKPEEDNVTKDDSRIDSNRAEANTDVVDEALNMTLSSNETNSEKILSDSAVVTEKPTKEGIDAGKDPKLSALNSAKNESESLEKADDSVRKPINDSIKLDNNEIEIPQNNSDGFLKETEAISQSSSETGTAKPLVTESGYVYHADPYRLDAYDTTTVPTVKANDQTAASVQADESKGAIVPDISNESIRETNVTIVPTEQSESEEDTAQTEVPYEQEVEVNASDVSTNPEKQLPETPTIQPYVRQPEQGLPLEPRENEQEHQHNGEHTHVHEDVQQEPISAQNNNRDQQHAHQHNGEHVHVHEDVQQEQLSAQNNNRDQQHTEDYHKPPHPDYTTPTSAEVDNSEEQVNEAYFEKQPDVAENNAIKADNGQQSAAGVESVEQSSPLPEISQNPLSSPSEIPASVDVPEVDAKEQGLFATILGTVKSFLSNGKRETMAPIDEELERILFPERVAQKTAGEGEEYCEKISPYDCPKSATQQQHSTAHTCHMNLADMTLDKFVALAGAKVLDMSEMLACLVIAAASCLFFLFGYYCFCNSSREGALLSKLNALERSLLATHKENTILKQDLMSTRSKLSSIEDNSFGSNDMVMALKKEIEEELLEKRKLQEQIVTLEKELENAAEAGLELNKIVSELLSNQTGDESIISSVEELQKQLNEQQKTIMEINANLAEKSRENSELQLMLAEQNARLGGEIASLQQDNDELEAEKSNLQTRLEEMKREFEEDITKALEGKNFEIKRLQSEIVDLTNKYEAEYMKLQTSLAKVEALEECLRTVRRDPSVNISQVIDVANVRAELIDMQKKYVSLKERFDIEMDGRRLAETHLEAANAEIEKLKQDFHQSEKDKLEAQTRLEVLSNYFKEKETQLQKELSLKEAMWLKQQGETTSTVDRLTTMQEEIQSLKSQNDALRAEIEAQLAAHKAQTGTLENRAHETWLAARQSERRYEEARAEAAVLRRRLTALAGGAANAGEPHFEKLASSDLNNAPSPIHMESPGSPLLGRIPPPFLPPPFMGPPPPFMGMPPPFVPPGEMRPPPLGRLMSPPPGAASAGSGGSGHLPPQRTRSGRYSPHYDDYDDDDYPYDDDEEEEEMMHRRRRRSDANGSWDREDSYSPPRTYRSHSPADSRYNYTNDRELISTYDTETDFSPPVSPRDRRNRGSRAGSYKAYSPPPNASSPISSGSKKTGASSKGHLSSGSDKSFNSPQRGKKSGKSAV